MLSIIAGGIFTVAKTMALKLLTGKGLEWLLFFSAELIAESTKTTKDDEFVKKVKEIYHS